ncbi:UXP [Simian adenovirus DM-2014]|uniref:UXP n=1 Tax=Simian adenovirus DM-2014 TaxID=1560346 RepID=A0A097IWE5_9ADEN|nr:UXP [Simian adenovirus DM-2014]AIT71001.1 UXP [Simian adenovirus DM-2014]
MNIIDSKGCVRKFDIVFKVWRKFAYFKRICYDSWEEGKWVRLNTNTTDKFFAEFRAFAARFSSPKPSKIFGTSCKEGKSGRNNGQQSGPSRSNTRKNTSCSPKKESSESCASPSLTGGGTRQRRRGRRSGDRGFQLPSHENIAKGRRHHCF